MWLVVPLLTVFMQPAFSMQLVGHRGASAHAPENTLESIMLAYQQGAFAAECDIQVSKDGKLILLHDESLLRTGGVNRRAAGLSYKEIKTIDVGQWKAEQWKRVTIPLLGDVVKKIPDGRLLFVEIKAGDTNENVSDELLGALIYFINATPRSVLDKLVFISFNHDVLKQLKFLFSHCAFIPILTHKQWPGTWPQVQQNADIKPYIAMAKNYGFLGLMLEYGQYVSGSVVRAIHEQGLMVAIWNNADDDTVTTAKKMQQAGVDFYNTNDVAYIKEELSLF